MSEEDVQLHMDAVAARTAQEQIKSNRSSVGLSTGAMRHSQLQLIVHCALSADGSLSSVNTKHLVGASHCHKLSVDTLRAL